MPALWSALLWSRRDSRRVSKLTFTASAPAVPTVPQLPLELHFFIIDHFRPDSAELQSCSLVSLAWAAHIQSLRFRRICVRPRTVLRFLDVLLDNPRLGEFVTVLDVREGATRHVTPPSALAALFPVLHCLPQLHTLGISHKNVEIGLEMLLQQTGVCTRVTTLRLRFCRFETPDALYRFIGAFRLLRSLEVFQCDTGQTTPHPLAPTMRQAASYCFDLASLALGTYPQTPLIQWLTTDDISLSVDRLRILSFGNDASSFNALLAKIGSGLKSLEVPGPHTRRRGSTAEDTPLDLRPCCALSTLTFSERSPSQTSKTVLATLAQLRANGAQNSLTTLSFDVALSTPYKDVPWEEVELAILGLGNNARFPRLQAVVFHLSAAMVPRRPVGYVTAYREAVLFLEDKMAALKAKGSLQFVEEDDDESA
ncbi:hypothetical protein MIND_01232200 [Mycena indigotica]|uniref:F-box domain-containing protein n=1 Tax=Mycena indigotica TaxID=2126181 RepID=A0A8H6S4U1_9AGAR|nr:uncharacterized protein MIND_01232200 [Mycena indigotica]KAF7292061.1 hypothetical protein MIND_01232200 [Mycena indigotica]